MMNAFLFLFFFFREKQYHQDMLLFALQSGCPRWVYVSIQQRKMEKPAHFCATFWSGPNLYYLNNKSGTNYTLKINANVGRDIRTDLITSIFFGGGGRGGEECNLDTWSDPGCNDLFTPIKCWSVFTIIRRLDLKNSDWEAASCN